jgi:hypothetical protein
MYKAGLRHNWKSHHSLCCTVTFSHGLEGIIYREIAPPSVWWHFARITRCVDHSYACGHSVVGGCRTAPTQRVMFSDWTNQRSSSTYHRIHNRWEPEPRMYNSDFARYWTDSAVEFYAYASTLGLDLSDKRSGFSVQFIFYVDIRVGHSLERKVSLGMNRPIRAIAGYLAGRNFLFQPFWGLQTGKQER